MAVYEVSWHGQKSLIASPTSGNESWGGGRDPSDSPRKSRWLSPRIGRCRINADVLRSWSPQRGLIRPSAIGKINSPLSLENITSFIVSNSSRSATSMSPFQILPAYRAYPRNNPGKTFFPNWWVLDWSFAVIGWYSTNEANGVIGPLMVAQNVFHRASSHKTRDLECFADRCNIP